MALEIHFFHLPKCRTNMIKFSISFQDPKCFNSLNSEIRNAISKAESIPLILNIQLNIHLYFFSFFFSLSVFNPNYDQYDYLIYLKIRQ